MVISRTWLSQSAGCFLSRVDQNVSYNALAGLRRFGSAKNTRHRSSFTKIEVPTMDGYLRAAKAATLIGDSSILAPMSVPRSCPPAGGVN